MSELETETQLHKMNSFGSSYLPKLKRKAKIENENVLNKSITKTEKMCDEPTVDRNPVIRLDSYISS